MSENIVVRFRIDGVLKHASEFSKKIYDNLVTRVKILGQMDISNRFMPQDGEFKIVINDKTYEFRVSSMPVIHGEKIVFRVLQSNMEIFSLEKLGFALKDYYTLHNILQLKQGLVIVTGATGSGKTTTLYSLLREILSEERNIVTLEKPIECTMEGLNQVPIEGLGNNSYEDIVKTVLRQDPDVIMIGEILDSATARVAIDAALTGHLVLTTLHTNDAVSTILRLRNMGVDSDLLVDAVTLILSQKLTRCICSECREAYIMSEEERILMDAGEEKFSIYRGRGCRKCNYTGYKGRTVAYELMIMEDKIKDLIIRGCDINFRESYGAFKKRNMDDCFKDLVRNGITTVDEYFHNMQCLNTEKVVGRKYGV